jgi:hypothetical protein
MASQQNRSAEPSLSKAPAESLLLFAVAPVVPAFVPAQRSARAAMAARTRPAKAARVAAARLALAQFDQVLAPHDQA